MYKRYVFNSTNGYHFLYTDMNNICVLFKVHLHNEYVDSERFKGMTLKQAITQIEKNTAFIFLKEQQPTIVNNINKNE